MTNTEAIYEAIKHYSNDDKHIFDIVLHIICNAYSRSEIMQLLQISQGEAKKVYISNDKLHVYKIEEGQSNLRNFIEEVYLLNNLLKDRFALDFVSIEKHNNKYACCFMQPYYKPFDCKTKLDCIKLKVCINTYMESIGYLLDKRKSDVNDNFNLEYFNDKYLIFDLTNKNVTLINEKQLFFYDAEIYKKL